MLFLVFSPFEGLFCSLWPNVWLQISMTHNHIRLRALHAKGLNDSLCHLSIQQQIVSKLENANKSKLDRAAIWLSGLCLIHCLALPLTLLLMPALNSWLSDTETMAHWLLLAFAVPISLLALWRGYQTAKSTLTLVLGGVGLLLMFLAVIHVMGESWEIPLTVVGVILVLIAHIRNLTQHQHNSE
jgi:hypothetical protein